MDLHRFRFKAMGSPCELRLYADKAAEARAIADRARQDILRLERKYSRYRDDSLLTEINRVAGRGGSIMIDEETRLLLDYADACYVQSDGLFDVTSGVLRAVWDFNCGKIPDQAAIAAVLKAVGWRKVQRSSDRLSFDTENMELDFGGMVKEYAADRAAVICRDAGCRSGYIDLGGDIQILAPHPDGSPWRVGVRHPRQPDSTLATVEVSQGGIASSGDYERFIMIDGSRYCHILSPLTGWPIAGFAGVTVFAPNCLVAGSASTIGMLKQDQGAQWLHDLGLSHVWMDQEERVGGLLDRRCVEHEQNAAGS